MYVDGEYKSTGGFEYIGNELVRYTNPVPWGGIDGSFEHIDFLTGTNRIGEMAFAQSNLTGIDFPETVKSIGKGAFKNCDNLKDIILPEGLEVIENSAFENCTGLEKIILPSTIKEIGDSAFENCKNLRDINLPESLVKIGARAFAYTALENVVMPEKLDELGMAAFMECKDLKTIKLSVVRKLPERLLAGCGALIHVRIPEGVEILGSHLFHDCGTLTITGSVVLPSTIKNMTFAFSTNDIDTFTLYATPGTYAYEEASQYGCYLYDSAVLSEE